MFTLSRANIEREILKLGERSAFPRLERILLVVTSKQIGETLLKELVSQGAVKTAGNKLSSKVKRVEDLPSQWLATDKFLSQKFKDSRSFDEEFKKESSNVIILAGKTTYEYLVCGYLNLRFFDLVIFEDVALTKEPQ